MITAQSLLPVLGAKQALHQVILGRNVDTFHLIFRENHMELLYFISGSPLHKAMPVNIPTWKQPAANRPPMRSSIEGLNQEIERLVLKGTKNGSNDQEREEEKTFHLATPEGHRAPLADMLRSTRSRSVNTQTPAAGEFTTHSSQSSGKNKSVKVAAGICP